MAERRTPRVALDKLAFLMAFVPYLSQRGRVSVAEAAEHFGYDEEYIRRSAWALATTGVANGPLPDGDLFDLDFDALEQDDEIALVYRIAIDEEVPRLSGREAAALIAGLQLLAKDPVIAESPDYTALIAKLRRGAASDPESTAVAAAHIPNFTPLRAAILDGRRVAFDYRAAGSAVSARREVEPLRIEAIDADFHLRAWCLLRGAVRTFRLDRISALEVLETPIEHDVTVLDEAASAFIGGADETIVTIRFDAAAEHLAMTYRPISIDIDRKAGSAQMQVAIAAPSTLQRLLTELPGATVVGPLAVRQAIRDWASAALDRYSDAAQ